MKTSTIVVEKNGKRKIINILQLADFEEKLRKRLCVTKAKKKEKYSGCKYETIFFGIITRKFSES